MERSRSFQLLEESLKNTTSGEKNDLFLDLTNVSYYRGTSKGGCI